MIARSAPEEAFTMNRTEFIWASLYVRDRRKRREIN